MTRQPAYTPSGPIDQSGQTIQGSQTNIANNLHIDSGDFVARDKVIIQRLDPADVRNQRNHAALRHMVRTFWIDGVLKHSLYNEVLVRLDLAERPNAVDNRPWDLILQRPGIVERRLAPGTPMIDVFDEMGHFLLILGEPGSGKTTMLLELACDLLKRADEDTTQLTPVVFNLSSWTQHHQSLDIWLLNELRTKYNIPSKVADSWLQQDELVLLLDGLDEVQADLRNACVTAINQFHQKHMLPLAICSRLQEYENLSTRLKLHGAVLLQPLNDLQIEEYLNKVGAAAAVRQVVHTIDDELSDLSRSPLLLSIMTLAYQGQPSANTPVVDATRPPRAQLFDTYVHRLLRHRGSAVTYPPSQLIYWLRWLAMRLVQSKQTIFLIENLQPTWLATSQLYVYLLLSRITGTLVIGFVTGFCVALITNITSRLSGGYFYLEQHPYIGLTAGLLITTSCTISTLITDGLELMNKKGESQQVRLTVYTYFVSNALIIALTSGTLAGLMSGMQDGIWFGLGAACLFGTFLTLIRHPLGLYHEIQSVESLRFSWKSALHHALWGFGIGLVIGTVAGLGSLINEGSTMGSVVWPVAGPVYTMFWGLRSLLENLGIGKVPFMSFVFGITTALVTGAVYGLRNQEIQTTSYPNQGMWLSAQNSLLSGLIVGVGVSSPLALLIWLSSTLGIAFVGFLFFTLFLGGTVALWKGGLDVLRHFILRLILVHARTIPWHYANFLDYCVDRIFLRRVGGGYIFVHRLLMEHIAALTDEDIQHIAAGLEK